MSVLQKLLAEFEAADAEKAAAAQAAADKAEKERRAAVEKFKDSRIASYLLNQAAELRAAGFDANVEHQDDRAYARMNFAGARKTHDGYEAISCPYALTFSAHQGHLSAQVQVRLTHTPNNGFDGFEEHFSLPLEFDKLERLFERALRKAMSAEREIQAKRK